MSPLGAFVQLSTLTPSAIVRTFRWPPQAAGGCGRLHLRAGASRHLGPLPSAYRPQRTPVQPCRPRRPL